MNLISKALTQGLSPDNILQYVIRHFPKHKKQIEKAITQGFTAERIIDFLGGGRQEVNKNTSSTLYGQSRETDAKNLSQVKKNIGKGALLAGGALASTALTRALPQAAQSLLESEQPQNNMPNSDNVPQQLMKESLPTQQPQENLPQTLNAPSQQPPVNSTLTPSITQTPQNPQPQGNALQPTAPPLPEALHKQVSNMLAAGNDIPTIDGTIKTTQPKIAKEYEKATGQPIARAIEEFAKSNPVQEGKPEPMGTMPRPESEGKLHDKEIAKPEVKKTVALPNGDIGEVTDIRQGIATVESNGKTYTRKPEELIESPLPKKELDELYDDLSKGIEAETGEELSRMANLVGYDAKERALIFHPTGPKAALYGYLKLDDDEVKELMETQALRKTSGENYVGAWKEGTKSPYGSKLSAFIKKLQAARGGKGSEYGFKFELLYDALEPAKIAKKEKFEEKQKSERAKKLKEKEDDKKRKAKKPRSN